MTKPRLALACTALVLIAACHSTPTGVLERGGSRLPDDSGVVTSATLERIQLAGKRNYSIAPNVESFTTRNHTVQSLLSWPGTYVQIGLDGQHRVAWIAGIGSVVKTQPPVVFYSGVITKIDRSKRQVFFDDGTVLVYARGVHVPAKGDQVVCRIDPSASLVTAIAQA